MTHNKAKGSHWLDIYVVNQEAWEFFFYIVCLQVDDLLVDFANLMQVQDL